MLEIIKGGVLSAINLRTDEKMAAAAVSVKNLLPGRPGSHVIPPPAGPLVIRVDPKLCETTTFPLSL